MMDYKDDELLTPGEVSSLLKIKVETLCEWRNRGKPALPYVKIGGAVRYRYGDIKIFIKDNLHNENRL